MKQKSLLVGVLAVAMALVIALTCILVYASPAKSVSAEGEQQTELSDGAQAEAPAAVAAYDFTSAGFDQSRWTAWRATAGTLPVVAEGTGLSITGGYQELTDTTGAVTSKDATSSYGTANPLKGKLTDGFSVILNGAVTDLVDDYCNLFGFTKAAGTAPAQTGNNFFLVNSSGNGMHLNNIGTSDDSNDYYDITPENALDMYSTSQYILTVSDTTLTVYLNGTLQTQYVKGTDFFNGDTVDFVNNSDWFLLGRVCTFWGNGTATVQGVSFYDTALTADEIEAINGSYADFTQLNALLDSLSSFSVSNYDTSAADWEAAYKTFTDARSAAEGLSFLTAKQQQVDDAVSTLQTAYAALEAFLREADITDGLVAAFPLDSASGGTNIVTDSTNDADKVVYMNGSNAKGAVTATEQLSGSDRFATYQGVDAAKLYDAEHLSTHNNPNPYADRAATSNTMGLAIPHSAFNGVTAQTGVTVTVSAYIENFYSGDWGRILQLGDYQFASTDGAQIFLAVNGNAAFDSVTGGVTTNVILNSTNVCSILARQWYSVSIVLDPYTDTVYIYASGYQLAEGAIEYKLSTYAYTATHAHITKLIGSIASADAENWIGRSFWDDADRSVVGAASNLTVYNRVLSAKEIGMLHATDDLSDLVAA